MATGPHYTLKIPSVLIGQFSVLSLSIEIGSLQTRLSAYERKGGGGKKGGGGGQNSPSPCHEGGPFEPPLDRPLGHAPGPVSYLTSEIQNHTSGTQKRKEKQCVLKESKELQ